MKTLHKILTTKLTILIAFTSVLLLTNCTVQKRLHRPGWHVEWNKKYSSSPSKQIQSESDDQLVSNENNPSIEVTNEEYLTMSTPETESSSDPIEEYVQEQIFEDYTDSPISEIEAERDELPLEESLYEEIPSPINTDDSTKKITKGNPWILLYILGGILIFIAAALFVYMLLTSLQASIISLALLILGFISLIVAGGLSANWKKANRKLAEPVQEIEPEKVEPKELTEEELAFKAQHNRRVAIILGIIVAVVVIGSLLSSPTVFAFVFGV